MLKPVKTKKIYPTHGFVKAQRFATIISIIGGNLGLWLGVSFAQIWGFLPIAKCFECFFKDKNVVKLK